MRSCVQVMLRPLLQAGRPTVELGLPPLAGVPPLDPNVEESLCAAVGALLAYHGYQTDPNWLMGVSGAAFRLGWRTDLLCCPSALFVYDRDPLQALGQALGASFRRRGGQSFVRALELLRKQLALGRPVLTSGLPGEAEWAVILGVSSLEYQPGRHYYDPPVPIVQVTARLAGDHEPRRISATAWSGCLPGTGQRPLWQPTPLAWIECAQPALDPASVLRGALGAAVRQGQGGRVGPYVSGLPAYGAWAALLRREDEYETLAQAEIERQAWGHTFIAGRIAAARRAAVGFLDTAAATTGPRAASRLLALAARQYQAVAEGLERMAAFFPETDRERAEAYADRSIREAAALLLTRCAQREKTALSYIAKALDRLEGAGAVDPA